MLRYRIDVVTPDGEIHNDVSDSFFNSLKDIMHCKIIGYPIEDGGSTETGNPECIISREPKAS